MRALIIGASGGIGSAIVSALSSKGVEVVSRSRAQDGLDVTDEASVEAMFAGLSGVFDLIFVATGALSSGTGPEKSLKALTSAEMQAQMLLNCVGPALCLKHGSAYLPRDGRSVFAVLSARVGSIGDNQLGGWYSYRASKAALNQVVRGAAIEIGRKRKEAVVVALHPGTVATSFTSGFPAHDKVTPDEAAAHLISVMEGLSVAQSGGFFDYAGREIPW